MIGSAVAAVHSLPEGAAARFDAFHALLTDGNTRMDLTAVLSDEEALTRHYLDSLTALPHLPHGASVIDIGTGAGFPGVPLLLVRPDLRLTLLEALSKRVTFLKGAQAQLGFSAEIVCARAEDFARANRDAFDVAISRAVASLPVLLELSLPLVKVGGLCIFWKGPGVSEELAPGCRVSPLLGGGEPRVIEAGVADAPGHVLVLVEKTGATPARFPRKAGMAVKRPL